jgi:multidrug efflux system outer membrane protein
MRARLVLLLGAALAASGCTMIPKYNRPSPPVPPAWPESATPVNGAPGIAAAETHWREFFTDGRLAGVIELALANNRDLRVTTLTVEKVQALYRIQRSQLFPTVGVLATGERYRIPAKETDDGVAKTTTAYSVNLGTTSWELDLFGRIRSLKASTLEQYLATQQARRAAQISLVAAVAADWLALAADTESRELARATLEAQQSSYELLQRSRDAGIVSDLDVSQAKTQVETARAALASFEGRIAVDRHTLDLLAGTTVPVDLLPDRLGDVSEAKLLSAGLPSEVLLARPDILGAEHRLKAANASIGAARAAFFPRISLTAAVGTTSSELSSLFGSGTGTWTFVPQIVAPLFTGGFNKANLDATKLDRAIAVAQYERAIQGAFAEVSDGLALRTTLVAQREAQQALVDALTATFRLSDARYKAGIDSYLSVLVAQRSLFAGQQALINVRFAEQANLVTLYKVLGGGA